MQEICVNNARIVVKNSGHCDGWRSIPHLEQLHKLLPKRIPLEEKTLEVTADLLAISFSHQNGGKAGLPVSLQMSVCLSHTCVVV
jgi:hypothetical protein